MAEPKVEFQHLASLIRGWTAAEAVHGDPYPLALTVRWIDRENVEFIGMTKPITKELWKAIQDEAARQGIQTIKAVRYTCGNERQWLIRTKCRQAKARVYVAGGGGSGLPYWKRVLIAVDQGLNVAMFLGEPDETLSARSYRLRAHPCWGLLNRVLDRVFFWQGNHCQQCYDCEKARRDLPAEYQQACSPAE